MTDTLPLWTLAPNWAEPIVERIEFSTAVLGGTLGHEQRAALRFVPRRSIEASFTPVDEDRTYALLSLQRRGALQWRVPLWFDAARLTAAASAGATTLYFDTAGREYRGGDFAYLVGSDAFAGERVEVFAVFADRITLAAPLARGWAAGARIHPCRAGWISTGDVSQVTSKVASFTLRVDIDTDSDYTPGSDDAQVYQGLPLLVHRPNWSDPVDLAFEYSYSEFDPGQGPRARENPAGRAFSITRYGLLLDGIAEISSYRSLLYRLRGRQRPVWVPSHGRDLRVAVAAASGSTQLDVLRAGLALNGGITPDIADLLIGSDLPLRLTGLGSGQPAGQERLLLDDPLPRAMAAGERASLLSLVRLEQDTIAINHITDRVAKSTLAWKAFTDGRDGSAEGALTIPLTAMNDTACGSEPAPPAAPAVVLDFKNGYYELGGVAVTLADVVNLYYVPGFGSYSFQPSDIVAGVGLQVTTPGGYAGILTSGPVLTTAAGAALLGGGNGFIAVMEIDCSGASQSSFSILPNNAAGDYGMTATFGYTYTGVTQNEYAYIYDTYAGGTTFYNRSGGPKLPHKVAVRFSPTTLAGSIDGAVAVSTPTLDYLTIASNNLFLEVLAYPGATSTLSKIVFYTMDASTDAGLSELSATP